MTKLYMHLFWAIIFFKFKRIVFYFFALMLACAADNLAIGTLYGEQDT